MNFINIQSSIISEEDNLELTLNYDVIDGDGDRAGERA